MEKGAASEPLLRDAAAAMVMVISLPLLPPSRNRVNDYLGVLTMLSGAFPVEEKGRRGSASPASLNIDLVAHHPDFQLLKPLFPPCLELFHPFAVLRRIGDIDHKQGE